MSVAQDNAISARGTAETVRHLVTRSDSRLIDLWRELPAPSFDALDGEYRGFRSLVDADEETWRKAHQYMWNPTGPVGFWLGKAFRKTSTDLGEGYNCWARVGGLVERRMRFATRMGTSLLDGKPAFMIHYFAFRNRMGAIDLVDEMREVEPGVYLGVATRKGVDGKRTPPICFVIAGQGLDWVGVDDEEAERI